MATDSDSSSDDSDHQDLHHLDQEEKEHNSDASNDVESESESGSGPNSRSNSEEASSDSDDSSSDDEVSSSETLTRNNRGIQLLASMLDLEASESRSSEDEDDDDDADLAEHIYEYPNSRQARRNDHQTFPKFALLPYELRQRIWEMFCPDLAVKGRVYEFYASLKLHPSFWPPNTLYDIMEFVILEQQTAPVRAMSAVYRESRGHVLRRFPDVLRFRNGRNMIRWDRENDIALLNVSRSASFGMIHDPPHPIPGFTDQIRNLAMDVSFFHQMADHFRHLPEIERPSFIFTFKRTFPNMKRAFWSVDDAEYSAASLRWCAARDGHHYFARTEKERPGLGEDAAYMYCWPSTKSLELVPETLRSRILRNELKDGDTSLQPLVRFGLVGDLARFEKLVKKNDNLNCTLSDTDSDDEEEHEDEELDEYESSGIDDSEISEDEEGGSESEDDLVVVAGDSDQEEEASSDEDEGPTLAGHWNGTHDGPIEITDDSDDESHSGNNAHHPQPGLGDAARFSSIEPSDSSTMDEESSSPHRAGPSRSAGSGRKRVLESDSEEDEELDGPPRKAACISKESRRRARATVVLSDDEDEDEERHNRMDLESNGAQRASAEDPVVISDDNEDEEEEEVARRRLKRKAMQRSRVVSDDEDEDEEDEMPMTKKIRSRRGLRPPASDTDDDEDGDEDEDEEDSDSRTSGSDDSSEDDDDDDEAPAKPLTLAEKLELHRRNNPIPDSDDDDGDDDDDGSVSGDDYDARDYADFQDDEEGNEIEDEDEEDEDEDGLIMDMAGEEDGYDEDEY